MTVSSGTTHRISGLMGNFFMLAFGLANSELSIRKADQGQPSYREPHVSSCIFLLMERRAPSHFGLN